MKLQKTVLKALKNKLNDLYLAGGTALSLFYFQHRRSFDLDFFTDKFSRKNIENIVLELSKILKVKIPLVSEEISPDKAKMQVYYVPAGKESSLKLDFVEDIFPLLKPCKIVDGISILSIEDIYLRKIYTAGGVLLRNSETVKPVYLGGRQEAKDFFDLFFLSTTFMPLAKFINKFCGNAQKESMVIWFRSYDRLSMKTDLLDIITDKVCDYNMMEDHFKNEIQKMILCDVTGDW